MRDGGTFDYIVAGAGSAGCVLANRLSADPQNRVLVLEAGGQDNWIWFHIPVGYLFAIGNPRADWMFKTEAEPGLGGRSIAYPRGKVIGGCSAINAMIYMRGQAADYDGWRQLGLSGWSWDEVLPYFIKQEGHAAPPNALHGTEGEWRVDYPRIRWELLDRFQDATEQAGIQKIDDFNTGNNEDSSYFQVNQKNGRRWSAAHAFLKPALNRSNLKLETGAHIQRVIVDKGRATGIVYTKDGETFLAKAQGEIVLAAGAVATPQILQLSGIGAGAFLQSHGIAVTQDLPGVGENLQDHLQIRPIYKVKNVRTLNTDYQSYVKRALMAAEYALFRRGPLTMAPSQLGAFTRSSPDYATPNLQFHIQPLSLDKFGDPLHPFPAFTASVCNLRPASRGFVRIRSHNPNEAPLIAPHYLSADEDRRVAADALKLVRQIIAQPALKPYEPEEYKPGAHFQSEDELAVAAGQIASTIFHPVGTAKMGVDDDKMAVLDQRLRVRGISGLRVADASAMPRITSGNTAAPTMMIAEKGAAMMREDAKA